MLEAMYQDRPRLSILLSNTIRLWAGAERFALDAALGLRERGHALSLEAYPGQPLFLRAQAEGFELMGTRVHGDWAPWTLVPVSMRLRREPVDLVWTMRDKDLRNLAIAAHLARRRITVIHSRECDEPIKSQRYNHWLYRHLPHRIVVNSESTRATTMASAPWLHAESVDLLPKGIRLEPWLTASPGDWPARLRRRENEVVLGYAGQFVPRKRLELLLRTLANESLRSRPWRLALAGQGPQEERLRRLASELEISERVSFCGFVEELPSWMASLDVFVLPSTVEGFGYVLAEAMATGIPIVGFAASSVPEVLGPGESGLLAPPEAETAFADALRRCIDDPSLRARMGEHGRAEARARHSLERMIDTMEGILYRALDARGIQPRSAKR